MLVILFGLAGAGKNFVGDILAKHFSFFFLDADSLLLDEMKQAIHEKMPFTQNMRDRFTKVVIEKISELQKIHSNVAIAQAFYKEKNRQMIRAAFPDATFILIQTPPEKNRERLMTRHHEVGVDYAKKILAEFDEPRFVYDVVVNDAGEEDIIRQLNIVFSNH